MSASSPANERTVEATFPENYANRALAGQKADFDVTVKAVAAPEPFAIDDEFAKSLNFESLDELSEMIRGQSNRSNMHALRAKRSSADCSTASIARYTFEVPEGLVAQEFDSIWRQVEEEQKATGRSLRRREHDRGGRARRISPHRRAPGAPRPAAGRSRRQGGREGDRRGDHQRPASPAPAPIPARKRRSGTITATTRRRSPSCARRSTRRRSSTTSSASPRSRTAR